MVAKRGSEGQKPGDLRFYDQALAPPRYSCIDYIAMRHTRSPFETVCDNPLKTFKPELVTVSMI